MDNTVKAFVYGRESHAEVDKVSNIILDVNGSAYKIQKWCLKWSRISN